MFNRHEDDQRLSILDAIVRSSRDAIAVARDGRHVLVNPAYVQMFGYERAEELLDVPILDMLAADEREVVRADMQRRQAEGGAPKDYLTVGQRTDGSTFDLQVRASTFELDGVRYALAMLRDVTEAHRTVRELEEANEKFRLISEQVLMGIVIVQHDALVYVSQAAADISGYPLAETMTWTTADLARIIHPDDAGFALEQARRKQRGDPDVVPHYSYRIIARNGELKHIEHHSKTVSYNGAPAALVTMIDVSARVRAEEAQRGLENQLQHLQRLDALGSLAGGIAHDFGNLLTAIAVSAQLALRQLGQDEQPHEHLRDVLAATERASALTRQLLTFGRKQPFARRAVDINALIEGLRSMLTRLLGADVRLETNLEHDLGFVEADLGQLEQALVNLATNARDAMPSGGLLLIETANVTLDSERTRRWLRAPGPYVRITVSDQGVGMSSATRAKLFEPFFTTKAATGGTGLGLSTTWGIIHQHDGWISVDSEVGAGASFSIFLPRAEDATLRAPTPSEPCELPRGSESIWVVEDDSMVREASVAILRSLGYQVATFASAGDALVAMDRPAANIDLLMTDIVMPHMDGCELADRMRSVRPSLKVLFNSGYAEKVLLDRGITLSKDDFLAKPFDPSALALKVRTVLDG